MLDGIRGIAIVMVLLFHGTVIKANFGLAGLYHDLTKSLWTGVDLFFVLSGFLITGILVDSKNSKNFFKTFYLRRTLRIFPLYYAFMIFVLVICPYIPYLSQAAAKNIAGAQSYYWLYLSNFHLAQAGLRNIFLGPTWSLAIEEQFYLAWPLLIFLFSRENMARICLAIIIGVFYLRSALFDTEVSAHAIYLLTYTRLDALAAGSLAALLVRKKGGIPKLIPMAKLTALISGAVLTYFLVTNQVIKINKNYIYFGYTCACIFFASIMVMAVGKPKGSFTYKLLTIPALSVLGKYCYALYLFNRPLVNIIQNSIFDPNKYATNWGLLPAQLFFTFLLTLFSLLLAIISWHLFEKHLLKLKKHFPTRQ